MASRKKRLAEILAIIREKEIESQEALVRELKKRGFDVTQATVSRDMSELRLEKNLSENGVNCYTLPRSTKNIKLSGIFAQAVVSVDSGLNTVVLKCHPGLASAACAALDVMNLAGVVGTLAGEDTIFILARTVEDAARVREKLTVLITE